MPLTLSSASITQQTPQYAPPPTIPPPGDLAPPAGCPKAMETRQGLQPPVHPCITAPTPYATIGKSRVKAPNRGPLAPYYAYHGPPPPSLLSQHHRSQIRSDTPRMGRPILTRKTSLLSALHPPAKPSNPHPPTSTKLRVACPDRHQMHGHCVSSTGEYVHFAFPSCSLG